MVFLRSTGVWLICVCLACLALSLFFGAGATVIFRVALTFALPVAFLYLPILFAVQQARRGRIVLLMLTGGLFGPACSLLGGWIQQYRGADPKMLWQGNGLDMGIVPLLPCTALVGFLASTLYGVALRYMPPRP